MPNNTIITSIDLGSNSFRVLRYDCTAQKALEDFEQTVGTAENLAQSGEISDAALQRVIEAIELSKAKLGYDPFKSVAVTTQAMRLAKNSDVILERIKEQTGVIFQIISGEEEARLTLLAMRTALTNIVKNDKKQNFDTEDFILLDIGGGSTELILYQDSKRIIKSFDYGIVTLTQSVCQNEDLKCFEQEVQEFLEASNLDIKHSLFLSTAGTPTTIAALKHGLDYDSYDKSKVNGTSLSLEELNKLQQELRSLSLQEQIQKVGKGREAYIDTGVEIFKLFYEILDKDISIVFDEGLREGVAIDHCLKLKNQLLDKSVG